MNNFIQDIEKKIINKNYKITKEEALCLFETENAKDLFASAERIRKAFCPNKSSVCSVINAKSGSCSEDCTFCAQAKKWHTDCKTKSFIEAEKASDLAKKALQNHISRISLVTSGRGLCGKDFETSLETFKKLKDTFGKSLRLCASFGIISIEQMKELKEAGVSRYHHNLETGENFFSKLCTTHTYADRINTIKNAKKIGLEICSGGIIGAGENISDRIDMALNLRSLEVQSVPINILIPVKGTPLEGFKPLSKEEILRTIAIFRFIMPSQTLRCAAGRKSLGKNGEDAFKAGANALISGDFLTIKGSTNEEDIKMLEKLGYKIETFSRT